MPEIESYDVLVIGSGEAGKYLAWTMAKAGHRTVVVERRYIGGSCPNIACLPSKNVIHSAKVASLAERAAEFGVEAGPLTINMQAVQLRKRKMVEDLIKFHSGRYEKSGAELIMGDACFNSPRTCCVMPFSLTRQQPKVSPESWQMSGRSRSTSRLPRKGEGLFPIGVTP